MEFIKCNYCNGEEKLIVIPDGYRTINKSEIANYEDNKILENGDVE